MRTRYRATLRIALLVGVAVGDPLRIFAQDASVRRIMENALWQDEPVHKACCHGGRSNKKAGAIGDGDSSADGM